MVLNFSLNFVESLKLACNVSEIYNRNFRHLKDWFSSLSPSCNKLLERRVIVIISDDRNGVTVDALTSHSRGYLFEVVDRLANRDAVRDTLFKLLASLGDVCCDCKFEHAEVFDAESFLEITLRVNRNEFILFIQVVELDGPHSFKTVTECFSSL